MTNEDIADQLKLYGQLLDLHNIDSFKARSYGNAAFRVDKLGLDLFSLSASEVEKIDGIGKSIAKKIDEIKTSGTFPELAKLLVDTPEGVLQMMKIKGLGPKKVSQIWHEMDITSVGELLYACNENLLTRTKGFGEKTQQSIIDNIKFLQDSSGKIHYAKAETIAEEIIKIIRGFDIVDRVEATGNIRRKCEVISEIEFIISTRQPNAFEQMFAKHFGWEFSKYEDGIFHFTTEEKVKLKFYFCEEKEFAKRWFETTGNDEHLKKIHYIKSENIFTSEEEIYESLNLPFIEPELREGLNENIYSKEGKYSELITLQQLRGCLHNHSTYSDGIHTVEQMANYCKELGLEYFGIADHSRTAVYAKGLEIERVMQQHREIDELNKKFSPFKILKGIESDILNDGSLDYPDEVLATFDYVVASIHQNFKMTEEKATERLIKAIENKYTTILGHPTGRLLLSREGYPINHKKIIDACAENNVVIELNAHPYRLDIDWRWIEYIMQKNILVSINPDAHKMEGINAMYYGVCAARKGGLTSSFCFNSLSLDEILLYIAKKKK